MRNLGSTRDVNEMRGGLSQELAATRDAASACLDRAVRRTALTLGALMVAAGAAAVLVAWSFS